MTFLFIFLKSFTFICPYGDDYLSNQAGFKTMCCGGIALAYQIVKRKELSTYVRNMLRI